MKFGSLDVRKAEGAILAHAVMLEGGRLKKGHVLQCEDITALLNAGVASVIVALLNKDDVIENEAAEIIASGLITNLIEAELAFTGRVNLFVSKPGIFLANRKLIDRINRVSPTITISTLADGIFVEAGRLVATVKIIPFAVTASALGKVEEVLNENEALTLVPSVPHSVVLIATQLPHLKKSTMDKTARILTDRLALAGSSMVQEIRVPHTAPSIAESLGSAVDNCDLVVLFGASAITDIDDVIPAGVVLAGGQVNTFGMPVDPGNLLLTGSLKGTPIIGAPGCARSPAENGFDWVLQRVLAKLVVDEKFITGLGVGGLLMEIHSRPQPRGG